MKYILIVVVILPGFLLLLIQWHKERRLRHEAEEMLRVVREIHILDDRIFQSQRDDIKGWPHSSVAKDLIAKRLSHHEKFSVFLGYNPLRELEYVKFLMKAASSDE